MGILKDASESILKYSGILVNKTEEYTRMAKLNLEIKKIEGDIDRVHREIGAILEEKANGGASSIEISDSAIQGNLASIKEFRSTIGSKKDEIEKLKQAENAADAPESGTSSSSEPQA